MMVTLKLYSRKRDSNPAGPPDKNRHALPTEHCRMKCFSNLNKLIKCHYSLHMKLYSSTFQIVSNKNTGAETQNMFRPLY